ncbi:MAG: endonuclease/exonuclease/phosphatase family protein [Candidatus Omnitrophica bacterium]|nr:endonuclease/exonuclease/phosphatase family protein [Candidatus Omnitrophota bacterium]
MKILTLNTWQERGPWQARWELILAGLAEHGPDLAAFQEVFNPEWAAEISRKAAYPQFLFPQARSGLAIYSRYPVLDSGEQSLSPSPLEDYGRAVLWVRVQAPAGSLFFFNTHLSWKIEDGASRRRQLEEILAVMDRQAGRNDSVLVGDLNATPDSPEVNWFREQGGFTDLFARLNPGAPGFTWDNRNDYAGGCEHKMPDRRIDQVLIRGRGPCLSHPLACRLVYDSIGPGGVWPTDHFGVLSEFSDF